MDRGAPIPADCELLANTFAPPRAYSGVLARRVRVLPGARLALKAGCWGRACRVTLELREPRGRSGRAGRLLARAGSGRLRRDRLETFVLRRLHRKRVVAVLRDEDGGTAAFPLRLP
jgi:hypothetical protein